MIGYCSVCKCNRPSLPHPAEGSCSHCYNHLLKEAPKLLLSEMSYVQKVSARKLFPDAKVNDGFTYVFGYHPTTFELEVISRKKKRS